MGSSKKSSSSSKDKDKEKDKEVRKKRRDKSRERSRERKHERSGSKDRGRERSRSRERGRERGRERSRSRERVRGRSRSKERRHRDRSRSRERKRERSRSKERVRNRSKSKEREHEKEKRRNEPERPSSKPVASKWDKSPDSSPERAQESVNNGTRKGRPRSDSGDSEQPSVRRRGKVPSPSSSSNDGKRRSSPPPAVEAKTTSSGDVVSMSIEETNKLRISLGLKPLQVDDDSKDSKDGNQEKPEAMKKDAIHAPPKNMGEIKAAETLKEKILTRKETRKISKALSSVKTLGEAEGDEDTASWISRMRKIDEEKRKAEKKAQMLAEMDEEFGIADLISEVAREEKSKAYDAEALKGLKVEHDVSTFKEGRDVTLVIKDTGVLDDSEDVLLNVNMVDDEKAAKNVDNRKNKPDYNPYQEENVDEFGNVKKQELLSKYDEEIHGEKKKAFVLGEEGEVDTAAEREREIIRQRLLDKRVSLETGPSQVASEYYTSEEMVQFRKTKKKRKLRKKEKVKADDLLPLGNEATSSTKDHGSRRARAAADEDMEVSMETETPVVAADDLRDEADSNVAQALNRTRRLLKQSRKEAENVGVAKVVNMIQSREQGEAEMEPEAKWVGFGGGGGDTIILDTTAEFCKQVGEEDKGLSGDAHEDRRDRRASDRHDDGEDDMEAEEEGGWMEVREHTVKKKEPEVGDLYQEAEPLVASGVAAALQLATKKGFVATEPKKHAPNTVVQITTGRRDVEYERQKEKERDRELSRYGRDSAFPEKKNYVPDPKIEYVDDGGRLLNTKEAFRYMSHKFHGRGSGRKKTEKRMKKMREENLLNSSSSIDTPLNTLAVLQSKQKASQSPYILVSGGAQSLLAPDIAKRK